MQRLSIIAVSGKLPAWAQQACDDYLQRLPRGFDTQLIEVKAEPRTTGRTAAQLMAAEAQRLRAAAPTGARFVALDERGADHTTQHFATQLRSWLDSGIPTAFLIGGPDGLDAALRQSCSAQLRLSSFTLPHALARVLLSEQLYRAASVLTGHPYHRE